MASAKEKDQGTKRVKAGSVSLTVRPWTHPEGHQYWRAGYTDSEGRRRHITRADRDDAIEAARTKAREIHNGMVDLTELSQEKLRMVRAFLDLSPTWDDLARWGAERGSRAITIGDAITRFIAFKVSEQPQKTKTRHLWLTECDLLKLAEEVGEETPLSHVRSLSIAEWLDDMDIGPKRRKDYRAACVSLWRWARRQELITVTGELTEPEKLAVPKVDQKDEVRILSPEELTFLFENVRREFRPWLALGSFSGLRSGEIRQYGKTPLDWTMIKLSRRLIDLPPSISKNRRRKLLEMHPTLVAWLEDFDPPESGPVIPEPAYNEETARLGALMDEHFGREEGWPPNCLRHSYGSNRVAETRDIAAVSLEMDNTPKVIKDHYLEARTKEQAKAYFRVLPRT